MIEYADFMLYFCNAKDREKLQRMQSRALRGCLDVYDARDVGTDDLHNIQSLDILPQRRMSHLLNLMFDNKSRVGWLKTSNQTTRNSAKIIFDSDVVHLSIYNQSPYFVGSRAWDNMPQNLNEIQIKDQFKLKSKDWIRRYVTN